MNNQNYGLFHKLIDDYLPKGFQNINRADPFMIELEEVMKNNNQFFIISDLLHIKILFTSNLSAKIIGVKPEEVTFYHFLDRTYPEQLERHNLQKAKMFRLGNDFFIAGKGSMLLSTSFKLRNHEDIYRNCFMQCYIFFREVPLTAFEFINLVANFKNGEQLNLQVKIPRRERHSNLNKPFYITHEFK
jgi:hypothetical protein